ncbi:MAG: hypothetical protein FP824_10080 [Euryarchaeota archaeon]|nr:hypothetical protein [Euryarchaeota archaeon]MBU4145210.1 PQQ-like beta-propeller repeat protein [Candidatus Thermoplasmatota archaeon]
MQNKKKTKKRVAFTSLMILFILFSIIFYAWVSQNNSEPTSLWTKPVEIEEIYDSKILSLYHEKIVVVLNLIIEPESNVLECIYKGNIQAFETNNGDEKWRLNLTEPTLTLLTSEPVLSLRSVDDGILVRFFSSLYYLDYEGGIIWEHHHCVSASIETIVDLERDGEDEIVVGTLLNNSESIHIIKAATGNILYSLKGNFTGFNPFGEVVLHNASDGLSLIYVSMKGDVISLNIEKSEINWIYHQAYSSHLVKHFPTNGTNTRNEITLWCWKPGDVCSLLIIDVDTGVIKRQHNISDESLLYPLGEFIIGDDNTLDYVFIQSAFDENMYNIVALDGGALSTIWAVNNVSLAGVGSVSEHALAILVDNEIIYVNINTGNRVIVNIGSTAMDVNIINENSNRKTLFYTSENEVGAYSFYWEG